jgi:hypothetical protein
MITDSKCFQKGKPKQKLCEELLISNLLEALWKENIINYATYGKARKEIKKYDISKLSK